MSLHLSACPSLSVSFCISTLSTSPFLPLLVLSVGGCAQKFSASASVSLSAFLPVSLSASLPVSDPRRFQQVAHTDRPLPTMTTPFWCRACQRGAGNDESAGADGVERCAGASVDAAWRERGRACTQQLSQHSRGVVTYNKQSLLSPKPARTLRALASVPLAFAATPRANCKAISRADCKGLQSQRRRCVGMCGRVGVGVADLEVLAHLRIDLEELVASEAAILSPVFRLYR
eukprot:2281941-Pleurochrysis_carterae.AAC.5